MSGIYIKGMEMPTEHPLWIVVSADGTVQYNYLDEWKTAGEKAVPVPDHGRLIDADVLEEYFINDPSCLTIFEAIKKLQGMPTIIPGEEGET